MGYLRRGEKLYRQALTIQTDALWRFHRDIATTLNNLGLLYFRQSRFAKAEPLLVRAVAIVEKALPPQHPDVMSVIDNLVAAYLRQQKLRKAKPLLQRLLSVRERVLGADHPKVGHTLQSLAVVHEAQKNFKSAEVLYRRFVAIRARTLGATHPDLIADLQHHERLKKKSTPKAETLPNTPNRSGPCQEIPPLRCTSNSCTQPSKPRIFSYPAPCLFRKAHEPAARFHTDNAPKCASVSLGA